MGQLTRFFSLIVVRFLLQVLRQRGDGGDTALSLLRHHPEIPRYISHQGHRLFGCECIESQNRFFGL
jgi:hypothetical protein